MGGEETVLGGGAAKPLGWGEAMLGVGEREEKPTREVRLGPWEAETGLGAANWGVDRGVTVFVRGASPGIEGLEKVFLVGVADWKSSKSSSSTPPRPESRGFETVFLPLETNSFGGVSGGMSSSKPSISISGSFFFGGSGFLGSRLAVVEASAFRRPEAATAPSSYSSYSSKRSRRVEESWNSEVLPPKPPPSP